MSFSLSNNFFYFCLAKITYTIMRNKTLGGIRYEKKIQRGRKI